MAPEESLGVGMSIGYPVLSVVSQGDKGKEDNCTKLHRLIRLNFLKAFPLTYS